MLVWVKEREGEKALQRPLYEDGLIRLPVYKPTENARMKQLRYADFDEERDVLAPEREQIEPDE